jgi:penicillin-binding protein 1A
LQPSVAWEADQILQKVVQEGTGTAANIGRPEGGKTGTAQNWTNAWFVGFIPQLVAAVWVGFPKGQIPMVAPRVRIPHVLGGTWPAQIWHAFMVNATRGLPVMGFPSPDVEYTTVRVDVTQGCLANEFTLPNAVRVVRYLAGTGPATVCTSPDAPQEVAVPSVVGLSRAAAVRTLAGYDLQVEIVYWMGTGAPPGTVLAQSAPAGTTLFQRSTVTITVARGPSPSPGPSPSSPFQP